MARYLQDVSDDDTRDVGLDGMTWVVRRTVLDVAVFPRYLETFELVTWCAGLGSRWAERRTSLTGASGGRIEAATLWVSVDALTGRPSRPSTEFLSVFGPSAQGREVSSKLTLPRVSEAAQTMPWTPRFVDFDVMGHVNNAVYWEILEQLLADHRHLRAPLRATVEHDSPIEHVSVAAQGSNTAIGTEDPAGMTSNGTPGVVVRSELVNRSLNGEICSTPPASLDGSRKVVRFAGFAIEPMPVS
jgi:acyl-ACP thioesterase